MISYAFGSGRTFNRCIDLLISTFNSTNCSGDLYVYSDIPKKDCNYIESGWHENFCDKLLVLDDLAKLGHDYYFLFDADSFFIRPFPFNEVIPYLDKYGFFTIHSKSLELTGLWHDRTVDEWAELRRAMGVTSDRLYCIFGGFIGIRRDMIAPLVALTRKTMSVCEGKWRYTMETVLSLFMHQLQPGEYEHHELENCTKLSVPYWGPINIGKAIRDCEFKFMFSEGPKSQGVQTSILANPASVHLAGQNGKRKIVEYLNKDARKYRYKI